MQARYELGVVGGADDPRDRKFATTQEAGPAHKAAAPLPTVRLVYSGSAGLIDSTVRIVERGGLEIGRAVERPEDIGLEDDPQVSRVHAAIELATSGKMFVVDRESRNGVFVNGNRTTRAELEDGDVVRIGNSFLIVRMAPADQSDAKV